MASGAALSHHESKCGLWHWRQQKEESSGNTRHCPAPRVPLECCNGAAMSATLRTRSKVKERCRGSKTHLPTTTHTQSTVKWTGRGLSCVH